jgi:hypothetical protein
MQDFLITPNSRLEPLFYQVTVYFTLSMLDEPAMLAMIFC